VKILSEEEMKNYKVEEAEDGLIGLETIKKKMILIYVLCDIKMPKKWMVFVEVLESCSLKLKP